MAEGIQVKVDLIIGLPRRHGGIRIAGNALLEIRKNLYSDMQVFTLSIFARPPLFRMEGRAARSAISNRGRLITC